MAYRSLEVSLLSARDLKRVNLISRMEVYAVVTISGDPLTRQCTQPDPYGGRYPTWNATFRFNVPPTADTATGCLHVLLRTERAMGDRDVGEVIVPLADILAGGGAAASCDPRPPQFASYQVRKVHRWEPRGMLNVAYRLGPIVAPQVAPPGHFVGFPVERPSFYAPPYGYLPSGHDLSMATHPHPPPAVSSSAAGAITTSSYKSLPGAYPQAAAGGHAAVPAATTTKEKEKGGGVDFGVGLGAGLVSGAISGILAGDVMMSEAAAYNYGYRAGLADGGAAALYKNKSHVHDNKVEANRTTTTV
ncbi:hypothetical protein HU200_045708 [Digitaria exilis]|uniref:C2 domain-containing protein n=1 Tax=Digitaria exilis TaxID=1010633 RepID=A0A835EEE3_9POAL|nr:hypothetical protein HU200_045708 [Digitaria exilis]